MTFAERYGPWAIIAGASEGTGRAFSRQVAAEGVNLILIARRAEPLDIVADEIRAEYGVECVTAAIDLAAPDANALMIDAAGDREVGLLVFNAGADPNGARFLDRDIDVWMELVQRNVVTVMQSAHHFAGPMKERGRGGILIVNSGACYGGGAFMAAYTASKAFDLCFAESLWIELKQHGVDVLTLVMSRTDTPAFRQLLAEKGLPVPADIASPDDVAALGLARLPHGPIQNWGSADEEPGFAPNSPADRRKKIEFVASMSKHIFGEDV